MKIAALVYTVLYVYLTAWMFLITSMDIAEYGLTSSATADLYAGDFYRSFAGLTRLLDSLPAELLIGIVFASIAILISVVSLLVIGGVQLYQAISKVLQGKALPNGSKKQSQHTRTRITYAPTRIYLQYCRLNN